MFRSMLAASVLTLFATANHAAVLYSFQGEPFTAYEGDWSWLASQPTVMTGYFLFDQPIGICYPDYPDDYCRYSFGSSTSPPPGLLDFGFSDGVTTYTLDSLTAYPDYRVNFAATVDDAGFIEYWGFDLRIGIPGVLLSHFVLSTGNYSPVWGPPPNIDSNAAAFGISKTIYCGEEYGYYGCFDSNPVARSAGPGYWTTTVIPNPAAVWLFGSALGVMGWMRRTKPLS